jgi:hypothetical protein
MKKPFSNKILVPSVASAALDFTIQIHCMQQQIEDRESAKFAKRNRQRPTSWAKCEVAF